MPRGNLSAYSNVTSATTQTPADATAPTAPTNLAATAVSATQVTVGWTASSDNVGVIGYRVERCTGAGCSSFQQVGTPSGAAFTDVTLSPSTAYSYRARAVDAAGNLSGYSNVASATTQSGPSTAGLVAAYNFDEAGGSTLLDISGTVNTGAISGATWTSAGKMAEL